MLMLVKYWHVEALDKTAVLKSVDEIKANMIEVSWEIVDLDGAGVREDVFLIWKELEEARNAQLQVQRILEEFENSESAKVTKVDYSAYDVQDTGSTKMWLQKNGLKAQNLIMTKAFGTYTFRHADGVVDIKTKPENEYLQTDAARVHTLIHPKVIAVHFIDVPLPRESAFGFYETVNILYYYPTYNNEMDLQKGSRALFGDVVEDNIYILIDTSQSMKNKLPLVKEKIVQLIRVGSSTNTLKALQIAFDDSKTQAIYLLTDGRPDQSEDIYLLKKEIEQGVKELEKIKAFYADNLLMDWFNGAKYWEHNIELFTYLASMFPWFFSQ
uniref:Uncharacterized protein n=1 Tax=Sphaerodactylus townsendi TaxID=933632 RepID=A0ACB8FJG7_9SAUR